MQRPAAGGRTTRFSIDVAALRARFPPAPATMPEIVVNLPPLTRYNMLLPSMGEAA